AAVAVVLGAAACGGDDDDSNASVAEGVTQVERQLLGEMTSDTAPGQLLELTRVIVPAGQGLAPHTHPGPQMGVVVEGTLTYSVFGGEVTIIRAAATANQTEEKYGPGQTIELKPGDVLVEPPGMEHTGRNDGDEPVVIYLSSLFPEGEPPATNVE